MAGLNETNEKLDSAVEQFDALQTQLQELKAGNLPDNVVAKVETLLLAVQGLQQSVQKAVADRDSGGNDGPAAPPPSVADSEQDDDTGEADSDDSSDALGIDTGATRPPAPAPSPA